MEEHNRILIAHPNETIQKGLRAIFAGELAGAAVSEATTEEAFQLQLAQRRFDLIVLHQSFVTPDTPLPLGSFVLLATEPTIEAYHFARSNGALAYLMENASRPLLQQTLRLPPGAFLIGPAITAWLQEYIAQHRFLVLDLNSLSPREQEILICNGKDATIVTSRSNWE